AGFGAAIALAAGAAIDFAAAIAFAGVAVAGHFLFLLFRAMLRLDVDLLGQLGQLLVGLFFFVEGFLQHFGGLALAEHLGIRAHAAVAGNFVVLHPLGSRDQSGVEHVRLGIFFHHLAPLFDQSFHAFASLAARPDAEILENLFQPFDVSFRLLE